MAAILTRRCFTVDEYHRMGEAGILHADERLELIEGEILQMSPIGGRHIGCVNRLNHAFVTTLAGGAVVSVQNPVRLSPRVEPQPDVVLLRRETGLRAAVPSASDVLLIIEVSDTTLAYDRDVKLPLYARAGIPEVWIVDVEHERVAVYRMPEAGAYRDVTVHGRGAALAPQTLPGCSIAVDDILD